MREISILLLSIVLLSSCMTTEQVMNSWIGNSKQNLIMKLGPPNKIVSDQNDGEIYLYVTQKVNPGIYVTGQSQPVGRYTYWEYKMFFINSSGKIYHWLIKKERIPPKEFNIDLYFH